MECGVCFEGFGTTASCFPCGHIFCEPCVGGLHEARTRTGRSHSIACPCCRQVTSSTFGPQGIRKVFLNPSSPSLSPPPEIASIHAYLAYKIQEVERLKAQLAAKEGQIQRHEADLRAKDAEITRLNSEHQVRVVESHGGQARSPPASQSSTRTTASAYESYSSSSSSSTSSTSTSASAMFRSTSTYYSPRLPPRSRTGTRLSTLLQLEAQAQTPSPNPVPRERVLQTGDEIRYTGYGRPSWTPVPECTAENGVHRFSGKGTNGYARRFTCLNCGFWCSESNRR